MRVTIVVDDALVIVNGEPRRVDEQALRDAVGPSVYAVQWYHSYGEVELRSLQNRVITDFGEFAPVLVLWEAAAPPEPQPEPEPEPEPGEQ